MRVMSVLKDITSDNMKRIVFPIVGWSSSLVHLPKITEEKVETFYRSRTSSSKHYKRSYSFLVESYIGTNTVETTYCVKRKLCFVKSKCFKSQKKNDKPYTVIAAIAEGGDILDSSCTCPVGIGGFCNHLVALLRITVLLKKKNYEIAPQELSCTDLPQSWNRPRNTSLSPISIMDVDWRRPIEGATTEPMLCKLYDSRKRLRTEDEHAEAIKKLATSLGNDGSNKMSIILENGLLANWFDIKFGKAQSGSTLSHQQCFEESGFSVISNIIKYKYEISSKSVPVFKWPVFDTEERWCASAAYFPLPEKQDHIFQILAVQSEEAEKLEQESRMQGESNVWKDLRRNRLTASRFGLVCNRVAEWNVVGIRNLVVPKNIDHLTQIKYGKKYESFAVAKYEEIMNGYGHAVCTFRCGIVIDPQRPWLGASSDRVIYDPKADPPFGLLEVKCPYTKRDLSPIEACGEKDFYIKLDGGKKPILCENNYLFQVMGQLALCGLKWCDFAVYFQKGIIIQRIAFNGEMWKVNVKKLDQFYFDNMLPFLCSS